MPPPPVNMRWQTATVSSKSARSLSRFVTTTARGIETASHSSHSRAVRGIDAVHRRHDEQGGVGATQPGAQLAHEVGVAGGVDAG